MSFSKPCFWPGTRPFSSEREAQQPCDASTPNDSGQLGGGQQRPPPCGGRSSDADASSRSCHAAARARGQLRPLRREPEPESSTSGRGGGLNTRGARGRRRCPTQRPVNAEAAGKLTHDRCRRKTPSWLRWPASHERQLRQQPEPTRSGTDRRERQEQSERLTAGSRSSRGSRGRQGRSSDNRQKAAGRSSLEMIATTVPTPDGLVPGTDLREKTPKMGAGLGVNPCRWRPSSSGSSASMASSLATW